ncbi:ABC transporter permease [Kitasatospora sp. NPDC096077]|uniref:ABC transporter permease n=1 Tax=Kitasatospora sp. NPDC096077 TaxID=3155544 RepID=UPI00331CE8B2
MTEILTGARLQLRLFRRNAGHLLVFATIPFFTAIFLSSVRQADRPDLEAYAVLAPALMGLWLVSLDLAGSVIDDEKRGGTLELLLASPAGLTRLVTGRVATIAVLGVVTFAESWLTATVFFGVALPVHHPWLLACTVVATALATLGTATVLAAVFVAAGSARRYANALGYPCYVLGGVLVPVSLLPGWLQPLSKVVYLSWAADLLRAVTRPEPVGDFGWRLAALLLLGVVAYAAGTVLVDRMITRLKSEGTVGLS